MKGCHCAELTNLLDTGEVDGFLLKPMNCPFHIKIYDSEPRSYRDLPIRLAEFGTVYRWEQSGELGGMTRVRGFTQDDAHIFCTEDQVAEEIKGCLALVQIVLGTLGIEEYRVRIGLRDPDSNKYTGDPANWDRAEQACREAAATLGVNATEEAGEAAFYGPKIDFVVKDVIGREWQLGTVQVDYNLPERFDIHYVGSDNTKHRPVMIHRAPFGSMERFMGVIIEHFAGAFPAWLAPEQVRLIPITDDQIEYCREVAENCRAAGIRASVDEASEKMGAKIRRAQLEKIPYMPVVGKREAEAGEVSLRLRGEGDVGTISAADFLERVQKTINGRTLDL
jgi:threonyl-tRNA synthetase